MTPLPTKTDPGFTRETPPAGNGDAARIPPSPLLGMRGRWSQACWFACRRPALAFALALGLAAVIGRLATPASYQASVTLMVVGDEVKDEWDLLADEAKDLDFEEQVRSRAVLEPVLRRLGYFPVPPQRKTWWHRLPHAPDAEPQALEAAVQAFRKQLEVERVQHSGVLRITVRSKEPVEAATAANAIARSFIDSQRDAAVTKILRVAEALDREVQSVAAILSYWRGVQEELEIDTASLEELKRQLTVVDARLIQVGSRYQTGSPLALQVGREKQALEAMIRERAAQGLAKVQDARERQPLRHGASPEAPQAGSLDTFLATKERRYQELLDAQAQAGLKLAMLKQPASSFGPFSILDEALPPVRRRMGTHILGGLLVGLAMGLAGLLVAALFATLWRDAAADRVHPSRSGRSHPRDPLAPSWYPSPRLADEPSASGGTATTG